MTTTANPDRVKIAASLPPCPTSNHPQLGRLLEGPPSLADFGIDQLWVDGVEYVPTAVYDGYIPLENAESGWRPSPDGPQRWLPPRDDIAEFDESVGGYRFANGTLTLFGDGTGVFVVRGGRFSIHVTRDVRRARWDTSVHTQPCSTQRSVPAER